MLTVTEQKALNKIMIDVTRRELRKIFLPDPAPISTVAIENKDSRPSLRDAEYTGGWFTLDDFTSVERADLEYLVNRGLVEIDYDLNIYRSIPAVPHASAPTPTIAIENKDSRPSLRDAEDKINRIIHDLSTDEQALLYKSLYNLDWRIDKAESAVRKGFRV